nr:glycosyltransferase [Vicinamibacterales bacterium]
MSADAQRPGPLVSGADVTGEPAWRPVSVIVAARDAAATLPACLASLRALDDPSFEVVVVDDGSTDATAEIARGAGARVLHAGGRGASAARNLGAAVATGEVLAFTDADCEVPPHWLRALVADLGRHRVASTGGPQRHIFPGESASSRAIRAFFACASLVADYTRSGGGAREVSHNPSCNSAYDRNAFFAVGGFTEGLWPSEDVDLDKRLTDAGWRCWYVPAAQVRHHRHSGLAWFRRMMRRYGRGQGVLVRRYGFFRNIDVVPPLLALGLLAQPAWLWPAARPALVWAHGLVALAALLALARFARP